DNFDDYSNDVVNINKATLENLKMETKKENQNSFAKVELYEEPKTVNKKTIPLLSSREPLTNKTQNM
ncbi:35535_t:CDS:1, partial [Gigaspora margarita]